MLAVAMVQSAQLIPEKQRNDGMRSEAEVGGSETFIQTSHSFLLQCLRETVHETSVQYTLHEKSTESEIKAFFYQF